MTQFIEPNKKSDLIAPRVLDWLQSLRTGLLSGFTVTAGTSGFLLNIASGRAVIKGTTIYDDETRLDQSFGLSTNANAQHVMLWVKYTYTDTFPPAPMTLGATVAVGPSPTAGPASPPTLDADSVKIADIFVPGGAVDLSTATIINAPPLPARGNADGDVLLERLIASNANIAVTGGGGVTLSGAGPYTLTWTADISIVAPPITHREKFGTAALVHASITAGSLASVPSNALLFTNVDRRSPNTYASPLAATLQFIDLDAPTPAQMSAFAPAGERDKIIILGRVTGGVLAMTGALGALPVPTTEPPPRFLGMDPGGAHSWEAVDDTDLVGGLQTVADTAARDLIPGAQRREGMVVYSQADDRHFVLEGGVTNGDWKELGDDSRIVGGVRVVADSTARFAIPLANQKQDMLVMQANTNVVYRLETMAAAPTASANWRRLFTARGRGSDDSASLLGLDYISSADGTNEMASVGFGALNRAMLVNHSGTARSMVLRGCELWPSGPVTALAAMDPGSVLFANGFIENITGTLSANLDIGGPGSDFINDEALPLYPANVYMYLYRQSAGSVVLRASTTTPSAVGTFGGVPTVGTANDYAYVGMLRPKAAAGGTHEGCWGSFSVAHQGEGIRHLIFDPDDAAFYGEFSLSWTTTGLTTTTENVGPATAPKTLLPTAYLVKTTYNLRVKGLSLANGTGVGVMIASAKGVFGQLKAEAVDVDSGVYLAAPESSDSVVVDIPNRDVQPKMVITRERTGGATARTLAASARYCGMTENINKPVPVSAIDFVL